MNQYRTHHCGELNIQNVGEEVRLSGWVQKIRNLGGMEFIDLRDQYGITQIIISKEEIKNKIQGLNTESSICVSGKVVERASKNANLSTGEIEIEATNIEILGKCKNVLPFEINTDQEVREDLRLEYRFLELRNERLHQNILLRSKILKAFRDKMDELGFAEIQTPILANSSPEGARDFLVPSRLHPGEFYALPQAPQQFKQLLMVSGFDKYYQIAPCFRDEDPRADRAPGEFYQLDFEMCYATQEDVFKVIENVVPYVFKKFTTNKIVDEGPFIRIPYLEAMEKYGIDKPDLRNPLIIQDATELFKDTEFNAFKGKTVKIIIVPKGAKQGRKFFDKMTEFAVEEAGAKGLAWTKLEEDGSMQGGIAKFITEDIQKQLEEKMGLHKNDSIFFIADEFLTSQKIAGLVRIELGKRLDLIEKDSFRFCFIVDFPMYELSDEGTIDFNHNPFSMPQGGLEALNTKDPLDILAYQYDLVCNGYEMASGAVRNHDPELMVKAFEIAGYKEEDVKERFGALYNAFQYGTPPHAGAAPGIDRMIMLIAGEDNLRQVIAFPKNKKARDLLMRAPSMVTEQQLKEVHIKVDKEEE
ncbi:MAG TPA: aspartate--tRNA ligase [Candidatus Merdicola faecigallinarum]|uniref:Aspartate--tRNA ligase n=1 Tax=Candidatus Merdicola faecigallinarum TaxID=2840862 RepID=A0A9D1S8X5_9FIRM|nr:aspartate--tRNA ligase [Candidatus Merdicola faecigallinarum]